MLHAGLYGTGINSYMGGMAGMGSAGFMAGTGMHSAIAGIGCMPGSPMAGMGAMPGSPMAGMGGMHGAGQALQHPPPRGSRFKALSKRPPVIRTIGAKTMVWQQVDPADVFLWLRMSAPHVWNATNVPGNETDMWAHAAVAWDAYSDSPITFRGSVDAFGKELATYYVHRGQPLMNKTHAAITAEGLELMAKHQEQVKIMMDEHARQLGYAVGPPKALPAPMPSAAPSAGHKDSCLEQAKQRAAEKAAERAAAMGLHTPSPSPSLMHSPATPHPRDKPVAATPSPLELAKAKAAARAAAAETRDEPARKRLNFGMTSPPTRTRE